jgi:hypothetical protein
VNSHRRDIRRAMDSATSVLRSVLADVSSPIPLEQELLENYASFVSEYEDALSLFDWDDDTVARWLCTEMFGAYAQAVKYARSSRESRRGAPEAIVLPRLDRLDEWFRGGVRSEWLSSEDARMGDALRHDVVPPYTEFPADMQLARILLEEHPSAGVHFELAD